MFNRRFSFGNPTVRSAIALLVLVGICASALPIPLGRIVRQAKDSSQPFPCQHCACGCKSAEQCWTSCCCYTPAQKAKWAKENGITPPSYAVLADDSSHAENCQTRDETCIQGCCSKKAKPKSKQLAQKSACSKCTTASKTCEKNSESEGVSLHSEDEDQEAETVMVLSIMAYKCSGQATIFSLLPWAIIETQPNTTRSWELLGRHESDQSVSPIRVYLFPDVPPPRAVG